MSGHDTLSGKPSRPSHQFHDNHISGNARVQLGDTYNIGQENPLNLLPFAKNAGFNSYYRQHEPTCLPDTRVDLLQEIYDWADGQDERCIFWLNGLAGTGKSTIARTVARRYADREHLGASFFFSKGGGDVSHAGKLFTTLAVQLADNIPPLKQHISNAVAKCKDIPTQSLRDQWRELVLAPLSMLEGNRYHDSYVLVVDALDECEDDNNVGIILQLLAEARSLTRVRLRVFLTSRPEISIRYSMHGILRAEHQDFILQDIPPTIVNHDISLFLEYNLGIIGQKWALGAGWPGERVLKQLVQYASGLFIWAATACRFIREGKQFAVTRLDTILKGSSNAITAPEKHLNEIYLAVLKHSVSLDFTDREKEELRGMLRHTLGSIVVLFSPLSTVSLSRLLHLPRRVVDQTLKDLHAILDIAEDQTHSLRLHHPSFRDFLLNKDRCESFWVDEKQVHQELAACCIQLMSQTLRKDICEMHAPGSRAMQVEGSRVENCLPLEIQYACLYWVQHLQRSGSQLYDNSQVHQFLQVHLLHWLEALSWMGKTSEGILAILSLEALIPVRTTNDLHDLIHNTTQWLYQRMHTKASKNATLHEFVHDAKRFALHNRAVIEHAPLQLYCSALVFSPENSIIRRQFEHYVPYWIQTRPRVQANWNAELQTLEGHSGSVRSVAFSPDGKLVVSGSYDNTVRLWDTATGEARQTLKGHSEPVISVAFSPDSKLVVSGSFDNTVQLWDTATGEARYTLKGHSQWVNSVAFSPDSKLVVSGSYDNTVQLWDTATGEARQTLKGHSRQVTSVAFSLDGKLVVSGSSDNTVRLWDTATGEARQTLKGHLDYVNSVAFSPDGKLVVSGSSDNTVRLWDTATGEARQTLKGSDSKSVISKSVTSVAFSPDGKLIVSGSDDNTVWLWDAATGEARLTLEGHSKSVNSVAFSPDSKLVVSGSSDNTVRLWDTAIGKARQTPIGHSRQVTSVAFSPDGNLVASGSDDNTVRLWDIARGEARQTLKGHSYYVNSVAFSPDSRLVVSGSTDHTVRLWDTATGKARQTLQGHSESVASVAFSLDGMLIVSGSDDNTVRLWDRDTATGEARQTLKGHSMSVTSVAFSPDSKLIVSGSYDNTVWLWDVATGEARQTLKGHSQPVTSVAFSPDGKLVVSESDDNTMRFWDTATGEARQTLEGHLRPVTSVALSLDSNARGLLVSNEWIVEGGTDIFWLPPDYRATSIAVFDGRVVLGHSSGNVSFFKFDRGLKVV